jgi:hypothetical protein
MTDEITPYISSKPGDLITAENWNEVQIDIKKDIDSRVGEVGAALEEHKKKPVDASTFGGKKPGELTAYYDERYVKRAELKSGWGEYRRYFKQISEPIVPAIIKHKLHRYPLVNVFELCGLGLSDQEVSEDTDSAEVKFFVYYAGHRDPAAKKVQTKGLDVVHWGDPLDLILEQFGLTPQPEQEFDDVLNDLWGHMFDPGLEQDHFNAEFYGQSLYIQDEILKKDRNVQQLKDAGIWSDLRMAIRPQLIPVGGGCPVTSNETTLDEPRVRVYDLSQDVISIEVAEPMELMVLLRT